MLDAEWVRCFPEPDARPARHTMINPNLPAGQLLQAGVMAVVAA